jgi:hypothetical protein
MGHASLSHATMPPYDTSLQKQYRGSSPSSSDSASGSASASTSGSGYSGSCATELAAEDGGFDLTFCTGFIAGDAVAAFGCAFFLLPRFDTVPVVVLLFSDEVLELELPLFALRLLRLRAIGISGKAPTTGVAVFDVRPGLVEAGIGVGTSISMLSGSGCPKSSNFMFDVSNGGGASAVSFGVDAPLAEVLSRTIPAACSSSVIALLLVTCCTEWEEDGRRPTGSSCVFADATELATEFFRARADRGRSDVPAIALLTAKFATIGEEAMGGEYGGSGFLRCAGTGAARGFRLAGAPFSGTGVPRGLDPPRTPLPAAFRALLSDRSIGGATGAAAASAFSVFFRLP